MPIKIPNQLPATKTLTEENIFVMTETRARTQDIRPLQILLLNLMPTKIDTEIQLSRLLGNTPLHVELTLMHTSSHKSKNTSEEHLLAFYRSFDEICHNHYDGLIITGAPVEQMAFEEELQATRSRLMALQKEKTGNDRMILSREQQEEITKLRKAQADTSRQLKNVRKELTSGIDSLGVLLKTINILALPLIIVAFGIFRGIRRRRR